jgi:hypothetical protein
MLLQRFLNLIDDTAIGRFVARKEELIDQLDPDRIYIENVRSFFGLPFSAARLLCEQAVRERLFLRRLGVLCPTCNRILLVVSSPDEIPKTVRCELCEMGDREPHEFDRSDLRTIEFYKLND